MFKRLYILLLLSLCWFASFGQHVALTGNAGDTTGVRGSWRINETLRMVMYGTSDTDAVAGWDINGNVVARHKSGGGVTLFAGRDGIVIPASGDYSAYYPRLSSFYADPSWITSFSWAKLIGLPSTLAGYGITDAYTKTASDARYIQTELDPVYTASAAFGIAGTDITHWNTAYDKYPTALGFSGGTFTLTKRDGSTLTQSLDGRYQLIGAVTTVNVTAPITSTGGATPTIGFDYTNAGTFTNSTWHGVAIADGYIASAAVWNNKQAALSGTGIVMSTAGTISYITGTSSQFVKADGSLDGSTYLTALPGLANGKFWVGNGSGVATAVTPSGDVTFDNAGIFSIAMSVALGGSPTTTTQAIDDNSTKIATTAYVQKYIPLDTTISAAYTLTSRDAYRTIHTTNGSNIALTIPTGLGTRFECTVIQEGAGTVTPTTSSTTFNFIPTATTKTKQAGSIITIRSWATANTYTIQGDLQ